MNWKHPSLVASAGALVVLAVAEVSIDVPWWAWVAWAVLTVLAVAQARRPQEGA